MSSTSILNLNGNLGKIIKIVAVAFALGGAWARAEINASQTRGEVREVAAAVDSLHSHMEYRLNYQLVKSVEFDTLKQRVQNQHERITFLEQLLLEMQVRGKTR